MMGFRTYQKSRGIYRISQSQANAIQVTRSPTSLSADFAFTTSAIVKSRGSMKDTDRRELSEGVSATFLEDLSGQRTRKLFSGGLIALGCTAFVFLLFFSNTWLRVLAVGLTALGLLTWLAQSNGSGITDERQPTSTERKRTRTHFFGFFYAVSMLGAFIAFVLRPESYSRPLAVLFFLSAAFCTILLDITYSRITARSEITILSKTIAFSLFSTLSLPLMFQGVIGIDPWWHRAFSLRILGTGHVPVDTSYSGLPATHLASALLVIVPGIEYTTAYWILISVLTVVMILGTFVLTRFLFGGRVACATALILSASEYFIDLERLAVPTAFAFTMIPLLLFVVFSGRLRMPSSRIAAFLILSFGIVLSHSLTALAAFLMLLAPAVYFKLRASNVPARPKYAAARFQTPLLFGVAMLFWWSVASKTLGYALQIAEWGFHFNITSPVDPSVDYLATIPPWEILASQAALMAFLSLAGAGYLFTYYRRRRIPGADFWIPSQSAILIVTAVGSLLALSGLLPARWLFYTECTFACSVAIVVLPLARRGRAIRRALLVVVITAALTIPMFASPRIDFDNPVLAKDLTVRFALSDNEQMSIDYIMNHSGSTVRIDQFSVYFVRFGINPDTTDLTGLAYSRVMTYDQRFLEGTFAGYHGLTVVREAISDGPLFANGPYMLPFNPDASVTNDSSIARIFSSGAITSYWQP